MAVLGHGKIHLTLQLISFKIFKLHFKFDLLLFLFYFVFEIKTIHSYLMKEMKNDNKTKMKF